ncbi:MAG TPA: DMT family transporter, partial [Thermopolyspora sp.]
ASTGAVARADAPGAVLAVFAGLCYAVYSLVGERLIGQGHSSRAVMGTMFGGGGLVVLPVLLTCGVSWLGTVRGAAVALHLAVFTTFVAYVLFGRGLRRTSASTATALTLAEPAVAAVLGVTIVGERLPMVSWCGLAALAVGLIGLVWPANPHRGSVDRISRKPPDP